LDSSIQLEESGNYSVQILIKTFRMFNVLSNGHVSDLKLGHTIGSLKNNKKTLTILVENALLLIIVKDK
jgi:hypothetical protein